MTTDVTTSDDNVIWGLSSGVVIWGLSSGGCHLGLSSGVVMSSGVAISIAIWVVIAHSKNITPVRVKTIFTRTGVMFLL
jgi:hypothetical protein